MEKTAEKYLTTSLTSFWHNSNVYAVCRRGSSMCKALKSLGIKGRSGYDIFPTCLKPSSCSMPSNDAAITNMVHPLAAEGNPVFLKIPTTQHNLDAFYEKFSNVIKDTNVKYLIITSIRIN